MNNLYIIHMYINIYIMMCKQSDKTWTELDLISIIFVCGETESSTTCLLWSLTHPRPAVALGACGEQTGHHT